VYVEAQVIQLSAAKLAVVNVSAIAAVWARKITWTLSPGSLRLFINSRLITALLQMKQIEIWALGMPTGVEICTRYAGYSYVF